MQPTRRPSLNSHNNSNSRSHNQSNPRDADYIGRCIDFIRSSIKSHLKANNFLIEESELKDMGKAISNIKQYHTSISKEHENAKEELKTQLEEMFKAHQQQIKTIRESIGRDVEEKQRQHNQKMLALNNEHGRRQQTYKEMIQKLMAALAQAQKQQQNISNKMNQQMAAVAKTLEGVILAQKNEQKIGGSIKAMVEEIMLRQENSVISSRSIQDMSLDELELPVMENNERCGSVLLDERGSLLMEELAEGTSIDKHIQGWLERLICFGFFAPVNQKQIRQMFLKTRNYEEPSQLLEDKAFPVMVDLLLSNMRQYEEKGWHYLRGFSRVGPHQGSRIELRNVNNLSELDVNSICDGSIVGQGDKERQEGRKWRH